MDNQIKKIIDNNIDFIIFVDGDQSTHALPIRFLINYGCLMYFVFSPETKVNIKDVPDWIEFIKTNSKLKNAVDTLIGLQISLLVKYFEIYQIKKH